jgi:undecaprenyl-diphosphatase
MTDYLAAILLGILEGLTEFLPVSSTGHLILATELLGFDQADWEVFNIAIQPAAILAIVVLYWRTFWDVAKGLLGFDKGAIAFVQEADRQAWAQPVQPSSPWRPARSAS